MNTKEHREATSLETILINAEDAGLNIGQIAKLIEEHFIAKSKEEATEISEEEIKKESAFYEAKCRCEHPDIESDDWYFDYVNEDFIAGYKAAFGKEGEG